MHKARIYCTGLYSSLKSFRKEREERQATEKKKERRQRRKIVFLFFLFITFDGEIVKAAGLHHFRHCAKRIHLRNRVFMELGVGEHGKARESCLVHLLSRYARTKLRYRDIEGERLALFDENNTLKNDFKIVF